MQKSRAAGAVDILIVKIIHVGGGWRVDSSRIFRVAAFFRRASSGEEVGHQVARALAPAGMLVALHTVSRLFRYFNSDGLTGFLLNTAVVVFWLSALFCILPTSSPLSPLLICQKPSRYLERSIEPSLYHHVFSSSCLHRFHCPNPCGLVPRVSAYEFYRELPIETDCRLPFRSLASLTAPQLGSHAIKGAIQCPHVYEQSIRIF